MAKKIAHLVFPRGLIKKPVIYMIAKKYNVIPNIRRAKVTENIGEVTLELSGAKVNLERAIRYLQNLGIKVEPVVGDIVE